MDLGTTQFQKRSLNINDTERMNRLLLLLILSITACDSAESPSLRESRSIQDNLMRRIAQVDSMLNTQLTTLREQSIALSNDTLLTSDSLLRVHYSNLKESANQLEYKQTELRNWRDQLTLLPSKEEIARGIANPFGEQAGDKGILQALNASSDTLIILESSISELIRTTTYERTTTPKPQE